MKSFIFRSFIAIIMIRSNYNPHNGTSWAKRDEYFQEIKVRQNIALE